MDDTNTKNRHSSKLGTNIIDMMIFDVGSLRPNKDKKEEQNVYNEEIIEQLMVFGYKRSLIITAMNEVVDRNDINEIKDHLDKQHKPQTLQTQNQSKDDIKDKEIETKRIKKIEHIQQEIIK